MKKSKLEFLSALMFAIEKDAAPEVVVDGGSASLLYGENTVKVLEGRISFNKAKIKILGFLRDAGESRLEDIFEKPTSLEKEALKELVEEDDTVEYIGDGKYQLR